MSPSTFGSQSIQQHSQGINEKKPIFISASFSRLYQFSFFFFFFFYDFFLLMKMQWVKLTWSKWGAKHLRRNFMFDNTILWEFLHILAISSIDRKFVWRKFETIRNTTFNIMQWQIANLFPNISQNYQARQSSSNKHRHLKWMCKKTCCARPWIAQYFVNVRGEFFFISFDHENSFKWFRFNTFKLNLNHTTWFIDFNAFLEYQNISIKSFRIK